MVQEVKITITIDSSNGRYILSAPGLGIQLLPAATAEEIGLAVMTLKQQDVGAVIRPAHSDIPES